MVSSVDTLPLWAAPQMRAHLQARPGSGSGCQLSGPSSGGAARAVGWRSVALLQCWVCLLMLFAKDAWVSWKSSVMTHSVTAWHAGAALRCLCTLCGSRYRNIAIRSTSPSVISETTWSARAYSPHSQYLTISLHHGLADVPGCQKWQAQV